MNRRVSALCVCLFANANVFPYEIQTHADISQAALSASVLNQATAGTLTDLGFPESINVAQQFPNSNGVPRSISELIGDGAKFEDDNIRPLNHFYNPLNNTPLTIPGVSLFNFTSPDWALEDKGQINGVLGVGSQVFSLADAREYLFKALTEPSESDRKKNFGLVFQTLGQVIHHVQDMAQPQHVRNDAHLVSPFTNPSLYELWTDKTDVRSALPVSGYAPTYLASDSSTFNVPRKLWHTADGKGIADFTNRNFVSAGTNFDKPGLFAPPVLDESKKIDMDIQQLCANASPPCPNPNLAGVITFYGNSVDDRYAGGTPVNNPFASSLSIFNADLNAATGTPLTQPKLFTLNRFNFSLAHVFLIPRAVGYSAGLINYFFRGKIDYVADPTTPGNFLIKNLGPEEMNGKFALYYDTKDATRKVVLDRAGSPVVWQTQSPLPAKTGQLSVTPDFDPPADARTLGEYMLVFSGEMGEERPENGGVGAVVAKAITNPYNGALYLAGEDSAGLLHFLKVDKNGLSDATGLYPFIYSYADHTIRERAHVFKQTLFATAPDGSRTFQTVGLELKTNLPSSPANVSFVYDPSTGALLLKFGVAWTARSPDPAIGSFEFTLQPQDSFGRFASVSYVRRFLDVQGQAAQASGTFPLPDPISSGAPAFNYNGLFSGLLFVSDDGTAIYWRGGNKAVRITLSLAPTAEFFDIPSGVINRTENPPHTNTTQTGVCTVDYIANNLDGSPNHPATATGPQVQAEIVNADVTEDDTLTPIIVDNFNGGILSYERHSTSRQFDSASVGYCMVAGVDYSNSPSPPRVKVNLQYNRRIQLSARQELDSILPQGVFRFVTEYSLVESQQISPVACGLTAGPNGPEPGVGFTGLPTGTTYYNAGYSYQGFGPCPSMSITAYTPVDVSTEKKSIYRALTDRPEDAVYMDAKEPGVLKFRGRSVPVAPLQGNFVADVSPIGEVFFATPDLSMFYHEPKVGNMPVLSRDMIPHGIVRLLAAIWM